MLFQSDQVAPRATGYCTCACGCGCVVYKRIVWVDGPGYSSQLKELEEEIWHQRERANINIFLVHIVVEDVCVSPLCWGMNSATHNTSNLSVHISKAWS